MTDLDDFYARAVLRAEADPAKKAWLAGLADPVARMRAAPGGRLGWAALEIVADEGMWEVEVVGSPTRSSRPADRGHARPTRPRGRVPGVSRGPGEDAPTTAPSRGRSAAQPTGGGERNIINAVVLGVWGAPWPVVPDAVTVADCWPPDFAPVLVDVVAFDPRDPFRWWLFHGASAHAPVWLGGWNLANTVKLEPTPLDWLQNGCAGAALLDGGGGYLREQLADAGVGGVTVATAAMADALERKLKRLPPRPPKPEIEVRP